MGFINLLKRKENSEAVTKEAVMDMIPTEIPSEAEQQQQTEKFAKENEIEPITLKTAVEEPIPEQNDHLNQPDSGIDASQEIETENVEPFYNPSKKHYSEAKLTMLEEVHDRLLWQKECLLNDKNTNPKELEKIKEQIQCVKGEIENLKYDAIRFRAD